jgi:hypothetical protein
METLPEKAFVVYNLQIIHESICFLKSLDNCGQGMVKYLRIEYRVERKEYPAEYLREFGPLAGSPNGGRWVKCVRERICF